MMSPYDWQEAVNQRGQYVAGRLETGVPVVMVSVKEGILAVSYSRNARKIYEIYDRLMFGGLGLQSDMEQLRVAAIEFTHREGFERSEDDVSVARVALALSQPMKASFNDFRSAPIVARVVFAEVADSPEKDEYYVLDFDGDYQQECNAVYIAGREMPTLQELIAASWSDMGYADALKKIVPVLEATVVELHSEIGDLKLEAALLQRGVNRDRRFYRLNASLSESKDG